MKEIEVKARVENFDGLIVKLNELGCHVSEPLIQKDVIYLANGIEFPDIRYGTLVMRIRNSNGTFLLTLKKQLEHELDSIECETVVDNPKEMHNILTHMGYHEAVRVEKTRRTCAYKNTTVCIDEVSELGNFVEVEELSEDADSLHVQEHLFQFLESLGLKREDRVFKGYDKLMYEKLLSK